MSRKGERSPFSFYEDLKSFYEKYCGNSKKRLNREFEIERRILSAKVADKECSHETLFDLYKEMEKEVNKNGNKSEPNNTNIAD